MRALLMAAIVVGSSCATTSSASKTEDGPSPIVATYGARSVRLAEVDAKVNDELLKLQEQIYDLRAEAAERIAIEMLVAEKAKAAGVSEDEWLAKNVEALLPEPNEDEMRALFERARARLPDGVSFDDVKPQIRQAVQREARGKKAREVFARLKKEAGFTVTLQAPPKVRKEVEASGPVRGNRNAKVTIITFSDFECPYCSRAHETVQAVLKSYGDKVKLVFRHYPLSFHAKAPKAAEAAACADAQGKFWEFHDSLFESQALELDALKLQAQRVGADGKKFDECLDSGRMAGLVQRDQAAGQKAGVSGTPAFFINGIMLSGAQPEDEFRKIIDAELARLGE